MACDYCLSCGFCKRKNKRFCSRECYIDYVKKKPHIKKIKRKEKPK